MRYLRVIIEYGIGYNGFPDVLEGYNNANWIPDSDETKSTSGYVFTLGGGVVAWRPYKQSIIARSTMESGFVALELASSEAEWLKNFLAYIPLGMKPTSSMPMHCDNQSAIVIAKNKTFNRKNRHIQLRHNMAKLLKHGTISIDCRWLFVTKFGEDIGYIISGLSAKNHIKIHFLSALFIFFLGFYAFLHFKNKKKYSLGNKL